MAGGRTTGRANFPHKRSRCSNQCAEYTLRLKQTARGWSYRPRQAACILDLPEKMSSTSSRGVFEVKRKQPPIMRVPVCTPLNPKVVETR